jgi:hypothetical protein
MFVTRERTRTRRPQWRAAMTCAGRKRSVQPDEAGEQGGEGKTHLRNRTHSDNVCSSRSQEALVDRRFVRRTADPGVDAFLEGALGETKVVSSEESESAEVEVVGYR